MRRFTCAAVARPLASASTVSPISGSTTRSSSIGPTPKSAWPSCGRSCRDAAGPLLRSRRCARDPTFAELGGWDMKVSAFHLMPHRELPADFERRHPVVAFAPPWGELADARRVGQYSNSTLDELLHAARAGFDGVCTNEHHQSAYGFMPSPNLMGSVLAKLTNGMDTA